MSLPATAIVALLMLPSSALLLTCSDKRKV